MTQKNPPVPRIIVVFRNDDPSALSDLEHEKRVFGIFEKYGVPQTLGVIPKLTLTGHKDPRCAGEKSLLENPAMIGFLRDYVARSGSEIALHGFTHRTNRFSNPSRRDFFEFQQLPYEEQLQMIREGTSILEQAFGERPVTFVPPWNRLDGNTVKACRAAGYTIISGLGFTAIPDDLFSFGTNTDLPHFPEALNAAMQTRHRVFLSVLMHSATIRSETELNELAMVLELASSNPDVSCQTVAQVVARWPEEVRCHNEAGRNIIAFHQVESSMRASLSPYLTVVSAIARFTGIRSLVDSAREHYWHGEYEQCRNEGQQIDDKVRSVLLGIRIFIVTSSAAFAVLLVLALIRTGIDTAGLWLWILPVSIFMAALIAARKLSGLATRQEIALAGLLCSIGISFGLIYPHLRM